jgi:hypothetical protein
MVKIGLWREKNLFLIHIRDYNLGSNGFHYPDPKGIALTLDVWRTLYENVEDINEDVEEMAGGMNVEGRRGGGALNSSRGGAGGLFGGLD